MASSITGKGIPAPGATISPQNPGMIPDWTSVPTHVGEAHPAAGRRVRPLTQYGTAEELAAVFKKLPEDEIVPATFEQATASFEERRKANPANLTPIRPLPPPGTERAIGSGNNNQALTDGE